jgi:hypothetical protein
VRCGGLLLVLPLALLGASCAGSAPASSGGTPTASPPRSTGYSATVTITEADAGRTIELGQGDTLVFSLGGASPSPLVWTVLTYPPILTLTSGKTRPPFTFLAPHAGVGVLKLAHGPPPGGPKGVATQLVSFTIKVFGRGG